MASEGLDNATGMGNGDFAMNGTSQSQGDDWPDPPNNREDFLQDLQTFHHARGFVWTLITSACTNRPS